MARRTVPPLIFAAIFGQVSVWTFVPTKICGGSIHVREDALMPDDLMELKTRIYQAAELLPIQGPISAFVFLNPLMGLEHLPFAEGVKKGAQLFGCQPYLQERTYREKMAQGRIRPRDVDAALEEELGSRGEEIIAGIVTRKELQRTLLYHPVPTAPAAELQWYAAETDALTRMNSSVPSEVKAKLLEETRHWILRESTTVTQHSAEGECAPPISLEGLPARLSLQAIEQWDAETWETATLQLLWRKCWNGVSQVELPAVNGQLPLRLRDLLLKVCGADCDTEVHEVLIPFCAAYADQGFAHWRLPHREKGFFPAFLEMYAQALGPLEPWQQPLAGELRRFREQKMTPLEVVAEALTELRVAPEQQYDFIAATLIALRGWAGLLHHMEVRADRVPVPAHPGTIIDFLAVRLTLDRLAARYWGRQHLSFRGSLSELVAKLRAEYRSVAAVSSDQRAFSVFQIAQLLGWSPPRLAELCSANWAELVREIEAFNTLDRRRLFHAAYERKFRTQALDLLSHKAALPTESISQPKFQVVFCIDAREESFRRHLETLVPEAETFGAAGFFGVPIYYRGISDAHYSTLCPIVVRPKHWLIEEPLFTAEESSRRRDFARRAIGAASHQAHVGSRSLAGGALLTAGLGVLASVPLVARVLAPRWTARLLRTAANWVQPLPPTRLKMQRTTTEPSPEYEGTGFTLGEMTDMSERTLRDIGLTQRFSPLVIFLGHGAYCLNNPHKAAYDCGACSGAAGGPNARALAAMLNDPRVRSKLFERGIEVPPETVFLGGLHNTTVDSITFYDLDLLPSSHYKEFAAAKSALETTCSHNAHERCRRFYSAPLNLNYAAAHRHVEARSEDLAQTRPEFGNATNAICFVGRRQRTRGLYLDRRSFLVSYDPAGDNSDHQILARILGAVVPVCEGINLQYFFSYIDSPGWGSGTKLPHNVTSLLGVMDGFCSDLRTGLPFQGVEIHEPLRLLFVIEATPETMESIMERNKTVAQILRNGWAQLAILHPQTNELLHYQQGEYRPYSPETNQISTAQTSLDCYRGCREHLPFALLTGTAGKDRQP